MGIFYQVPLPFIGGQAPLVPRDLPPQITAVPVNNPPFSQKSRTALYQAIARLWDAPPPSPFIGGRQPLEARKLTPRSVDNPPFLTAARDQRDLYTTLATWQQPQPWLSRYKPQPVIVASVQPAFDRGRTLAQIIAQWKQQTTYLLAYGSVPIQPPTGLIAIGSADGAGGGLGLLAVGSAG